MGRRARIHNLIGTLALGACVGAAGGSDTVLLKSGAVIQGTVLKRNDKSIWVDVGPEILAFRVEDVAEIENDDGGVPVAFRGESLFHTAINPSELSPKEHTKRIGPAVIKVSTPSGLGSGVVINEAGCGSRSPTRRCAAR
jgi:hypothetical protein